MCQDENEGEIKAFVLSGFWVRLDRSTSAAKLLALNHTFEIPIFFLNEFTVMKDLVWSLVLKYEMCAEF